MRPYISIFSEAPKGLKVYNKPELNQKITISHLKWGDSIHESINWKTVLKKESAVMDKGFSIPSIQQLIAAKEKGLLDNESLWWAKEDSEMGTDDSKHLVLDCSESDPKVYEASKTTKANLRLCKEV
jgi:hypothetical protein